MEDVTGEEPHKRMLVAVSSDDADELLDEELGDVEELEEDEELLLDDEDE